jgi:CoA:oxalate CoA-transferase
MSGPLDHVKVLDLGHYVAAPFCAKLLADMGADVIKVEPPRVGDDSRRVGPSLAPAGEAATSALHLFLNTNKRGVTLDLSLEKGREAARKLAAWADIVVEDHKPGVLSGMGLGYDDLRRVNPRLVMTSLTPFGQTGPYRDFEATEMTVQALTGLMYFNGQEDREPLKMPRHQAHMAGGLNGAGVTLTALFHARGTDEGQHVDVSIQESVVTFYYSNLALYAYTGMVNSRGNKELYETRDGWAMPLKGRAAWDSYAIFFDAMELIEDKYQTPQGQQLYSEEIQEALSAKLLGRERYEVFHAGQQAGFPFGVAQSFEDVIACPQLEAREYFQQVAHPLAGTGRYSTTPFKFSDAPVPPYRPAPLLGQHNREVFQDLLGYTESDLIRLGERGAV